MVWVCTRWWWSLGGHSGTGLVWSCLSSIHPHWVRFEFQFSVFRPARQQPPMGPGDHDDDQRGGRKIQVWIHPGFSLPLFIMAFTIGQTEYLSEISRKMWGWNFPLLTHLVTVPLLTRFSSVRFRQKAHSPKCWCKLDDFSNGIINYCGVLKLPLLCFPFW
jgi:hypothetical protein